MTKAKILKTRGGEIYAAPSIEVTETAVERGFAASGDGMTVPGFGEPSEASWIHYGYDIQSMEQYQ